MLVTFWKVDASDIIYNRFIKMIEFICSMDDGELWNEFCGGVCAGEGGICVSTEICS